MKPQTRSFSGDQIIFNQGEPGDVAYVILRGSVDIFTVARDKRIVLESLSEGGCFGEMSAIAGDVRSASAMARGSTELYVVDNSTLQQLLRQSEPIARAVVHSLIERVKRLTQKNVDETSSIDPMIGVANLLILFGKLDSRSVHGEQTQLPYERTVEGIASILGMLPARVRVVTRRMQDLNLLTIFASGRESGIRFRHAEIAQNTASIVRTLDGTIGGRMKADFELIEIEPLAALLGVDRSTILGRLASGELPDDLFLIRKSAAEAYFQEHGKSAVPAS